MMTDENSTPQTDAIQPVSVETARAAIEAAIVAKLGADWNDEDSPYLLVHDAPYLVRINRGATNLDFQCDLLGEVEIIERPVNPAQTGGRLIAWMVLLATMLVVFVLASLAGVFNG